MTTAAQDTDASSSDTEATGGNGVATATKAKKVAKRAEEEGTSNIEVIAVNLIDVIEGKNPRTTFNKMPLEELAESIKDHGILQHIGVEPSVEKKGRYTLLWGERRLRAYKLNKMKEVPANVRRNFAPLAQDASRFIENIEREELNPLEEAVALDKFMLEHSLSAKQVSETLGMKPSYISQRLTLLKMPKEIQSAMSKGEINFTQARELARMEGSAAVDTLHEMQGSDKKTRAADLKNKVEDAKIAQSKTKTKKGKVAGRKANGPSEAPNIQRQSLEEATALLQKFKVSLRPKTELKDGLQKIYARFAGTKTEQKKEQYRGAVSVLEWVLGIRDEL
jgi:ParB family chromosome partitioning protein